MDAFFASVEQLDNPALRGKPVIVGGSAESRGVVCAASYEARAFGVHSAMSSARAKRCCPAGIFLPVRMARYQEISAAIHEIFTSFTPDVEPVSVDEAFLDITGCQRLFGTPEGIAAKLKAKIRHETELTVSVGVAPNRFIAKIASDLEKPDGLVVIRSDQISARLAPLPVRKIWGVGRVTGSRLEALGIHTIGDLRAWPEETLVQNLGSSGSHLYQLARGNDSSPVVEGDREKSISNETTFANDIMNVRTLQMHLLRLADKVAARTRAAGVAGRVVQLKIRYDDFSTVTRRQTLLCPTCVTGDLYRVAAELLIHRTDAGNRPVRLLGVGLTGLADDFQATLFSASGTNSSKQAEALENATDRIRKKLGDDAIGRGSVVLE